MYVGAFSVVPQENSTVRIRIGFFIKFDVEHFFQGFYFYDSTHAIANQGDQNEQTAMQGTAVYACVRILAEAIAGLHCAENCNK